MTCALSEMCCSTFSRHGGYIPPMRAGQMGETA